MALQITIEVITPTDVAGSKSQSTCVKHLTLSLYSGLLTTETPKQALKTPYPIKAVVIWVPTLSYIPSVFFLGFPKQIPRVIRVPEGSLKFSTFPQVLFLRVPYCGWTKSISHQLRNPDVFPAIFPWFQSGISSIHSR